MVAWNTAWLYRLPQGHVPLPCLLDGIFMNLKALRKTGASSSDRAGKLAPKAERLGFVFPAELRAALLTEPQVHGRSISGKV